MAKLTILVAIFTILSLVVDASIYRTTVTIDEGNPRGQPSQGCRQQMQRQDLSHCERFLQQGRRGNELTFRRVVHNEEHLQQCCNQLRQMDDEECQCEAIKMMVDQQQGRMQREEEMQEMMQRAQSLPNKCGMRSQRCECSRLVEIKPTDGNYKGTHLHPPPAAQPFSTQATNMSAIQPSTPQE
ncbi:hypothetical protein L1049_001057 [Liquidambar formosana]|uniref:Bifunctional inhibitor/plant lipid transfer protein/seed storage helical domain-containing protein n=1 Tax=Liquidambar formosana TaxID=63359 RepID=A0AAP0NBR0_LIQFO